jgi:K+-transporting ATPase ATPase C chain
MTLGADPQDSSKSIAQPYNAGASGASNLGPTSQKLVDQVAARAKAYRLDNGLAAEASVPVDAVTASASGLDPHISVANARLQLARVARLRHLPEAELLQLLNAHTAARTLGLLGEPRVNVLQLNLALDARQPSIAVSE